jgi:hypothetical protein
MENEKIPDHFLLNRRGQNRYFTNELSAGDIGRIMEMSEAGMRIMKAGVQEIKGPSLTIPVFNREIKAFIVWQDKYFLGLRCSYGFDVVPVIKKLAGALMEPEFRPKKTITDEAIAGITHKDVLSSCLNLIEELENPDIDMTKLITFIEAIRDAFSEAAAPKEEETEKIEEIKEAEPADLSELLIHEARRASSARHVEISSVDFAVARLGLESVKKISMDYVHKKLADLEIPLSKFNGYESFIILKTVIFKHLSHFFGFKDYEGEGSLLLSLETKGIEILMDLSSADSKALKDYYMSSSRVYSEISRIVEKNNFGRDLLLINKYYLKNKLGGSEDLYDGYVLAHLVLNPCYIPDNIKLTLTKRKLSYAFLVYLTFIATKFIMDRDKESAILFIHMLKRAGMNDDKITVFLSDSVSEANNVLTKLGLKGNIRTGPLPHTPFKIEGYLHRDVHSKYLLKAFDDFSMLKSVKRMAIRYEDETYTHFILGKLMMADDIGLNSKAYCLIPCKNISEKELYLDEFTYFDLVILKDIDHLPKSHIREFVKLWGSFEGKMIVTFSSSSFLDFDSKTLYLLLKDHIADFPSYFSDRGIYERMIDHTIAHLKPFLGERVIDRNIYLKNTCSMAYIESNELQSYG